MLEVEGHAVVGIDPGGDDDVEVDLSREFLDPRDVAPEADHGGVDDRVEAGLLELGQLGDRVGDLSLLVPLVVVLLHIRSQNEDVLMHQGAAQVRRVNRTASRLYLCHAAKP